MNKNTEQKRTGTSSAGLSRRAFLKGGVAAGALAMGGVALAGCAPSGSAASSSSAEAAAPETVDEHIPAGRRATATLSNAEPIAPVSVPAQWDGEADVLIIGAGGGGLAGAARARDLGASVILFEKSAESGGATAHAASFLNKSGSGTAQKEQGYGYPEAPFNRDSFVKSMQPVYQFSIDNDLVGTLAEKGGEVADWLVEKGAPLECRGMRYIPIPVASGKQTLVLGQKSVTDYVEKMGADAGAEYQFSTECTGLVQDDSGRVVGVQVKASGGETKHYQAKKGVVLCAGGFGMNPDMLKRYIPSVYERASYGGPFPSHSGEVTRMALGAGADMAGFDSWSMWEAAPDNGTGEWHYFYGFRQFMQMPWINFDRTGKRCDVYDARLAANDPQYPKFDAHDTGRVAVTVSRPGGRAYPIFDSKYEAYVDKIQADAGEHRPIRKEDPVVEQNLFDTDWHVEFQKALDDGRLKKADTLDELAELLGLDADVVQDVVKRWNACCDAGVDDDPDVMYHYPAEWLNPIKEGPFYGSALGGQIGKTLCGVRVNADLQVLDTAARPIPGLFAGFTTAGGIVGETNFGGGLVNTSILGGCALSWTSGYVATESALKA